MIFPQFAGKRSDHVNLDDLTLELFPKESESQSPMLDPNIYDQIIRSFHEKLAIAFSWGGWMENRARLWHGSYITPKNTPIHVGIDLNAPAKTLVAVDCEVEVLRIDDDHPEQYGWGPRVFFRPIKQEEGREVVLIYAHLDPDNINCKPGDLLQPGQVFSQLGKSEHNGGWGSHTHIQAVSYDYYKFLVEQGRLGELDGYYSSNDLAWLEQTFPNPFQYIRLH